MAWCAITIRRAILDDLDVIVNFGADMARETEDKNLDRATLTSGVRAALIDEAKGLYLVAEAEGDVVGVLMVTYEWSDWRNGHYWWIQSVYVHPNWRRRGVFRALFQHVHQLAKANNVKGLRLYVERANAVAKATYEGMGMAPSDYLIFERLPL
jgi:ribosomal protein S18 acetylase RimI-like enzyme